MSRSCSLTTGAWIVLLLSVKSASESIQFTGHAQVSYHDLQGHEHILVWGGYHLTEKFLHYDINNQVDGLYHKHLEFNEEIYRLNLSNPSIGWIVVPTSSVRPRGRIFHSMSMSSDGDSFVIFGGTQCFREDSFLFGYSLKDVWRFNITNSAWTNIIPQDNFPDPFNQCS
mmetsp:Transcript_12731/g.17690  ORF Transcript_12731/g.17690 Transcript_12731/m.17690 type:complete len:170 (+) Transcript_12731:55-564(+)